MCNPGQIFLIGLTVGIIFGIILILETIIYFAYFRPFIYMDDQEIFADESYQVNISLINFTLSIGFITKFGSAFDACPYNQNIDFPCKENIGGISRLLNIYKNISKNPNFIFLNAGNFFGDSIWYDVWEAEPHVKLLEKLPFNASIIGDDDIRISNLYRAEDDNLNKLIAAYKDSLLSAINCQGNDKNSKKLIATEKNKKIITVGEKKIGIIGLYSIDNRNDYKNFKLHCSIDTINTKLLFKPDEVFTTIAISNYNHSENLRFLKTYAPSYNVTAIIGGDGLHHFSYTGNSPNDREILGPYPTIYKDILKGPSYVLAETLGRTEFLGFTQISYDNTGEIIWVSENQPYYLNGSIVKNSEDEIFLREYKTEVDEHLSIVLGVCNQTFLREDCFMNECPLLRLIINVIITKFELDNEALVSFSGSSLRGDLKAGNITRQSIWDLFDNHENIEVLELPWKEVENFLKSRDEVILTNGCSKIIYDLNRVEGTLKTLDCGKSQNETVTWYIPYSMLNGATIGVVKERKLLADLLVEYVKGYKDWETFDTSDRKIMILSDG